MIQVVYPQSRVRTLSSILRTKSSCYANKNNDKTRVHCTSTIRTRHNCPRRRQVHPFAARARQMSASRVAVSAASSKSSGLIYEHLICSSVAGLAQRLRPQERLAALDVTATHVSFAVSDRSQRHAAPFGVLARTGDMRIDARSIARAMTHANSFEPTGKLDLCALVVGAAPDEAVPFEYLDGLLRHGLDDKEVIPPFPDLKAVLFYSEVEAIERALTDLNDYTRAIRLLPERQESRKFGRFQTAMHPVVKCDELNVGATARARLACSEILQAVLDDMADSAPTKNDC